MSGHPAHDAVSRRAHLAFPDKTSVAALLYIGVRRAELLALGITHLDFGARTLTVRNMAGMRLRAELIALPCCSATGQPAAREGLIGASWALMAAGARGTLVTLWPVHDRYVPMLTPFSAARCTHMQ
jgi:integrase